MKKMHPNEGLRIFDVKWRVKTAGPSPNNNERIEVFLLGCEKAINGNPCKGCFNSITWDKSIAQFSRDPIEMADMINEGCDPNNKYVTIGGGEPTDQLYALLPFVKRLKEHNFHILMYTWRSLKDILNSPFLYYNEKDKEWKEKDEPLAFNGAFRQLLKYVDIIVDGEYIQEETMLNFNSINTAQNFIGSGNQIVWNINDFIVGYALKDINDLSLKENKLKYSIKEKAVLHKIEQRSWNNG